MSDDDVFYMKRALKQALKAYNAGETPIGCVITYNDEVIAAARNRRNAKKNPLCHAELLAIKKAARIIGDWRLEGACIYVTIEPCPMCAGAIIQSRIKRLVYGAENKKAGSAGSVVNLFDGPVFNHKVEVVSGVMREEAAELMSRFFDNLRKKGRGR